MEKDNEVKGIGNSLDFGARIYDSRLGKWASLDPLMKKYVAQSPYNFVANSPIIYKDADGRDIYVHGPGAYEYVAQLNQKSEMTITRDANSHAITAVGTPHRLYDEYLLRAINDPNIHVHIYTTDKVRIERENGDVLYSSYGGYDGSRIIMNNGIPLIETFQLVNPYQAGGIDPLLEQGPGTAAMHEVLESYFGGYMTPNDVIPAGKAATPGFYASHNMTVLVIGHTELKDVENNSNVAMEDGQQIADVKLWGINVKGARGADLVVLKNGQPLPPVFEKSERTKDYNYSITGRDKSKNIERRDKVSKALESIGSIFKGCKKGGAIGNCARF